MVPQSAFAKYEPVSNMPMGVRESLYCIEGLPRVLKLLEDPRDPSKNTISAETLAEFLQTSERPCLIVDCRFDYEYAGGHIENAVNLNDPKEMEALFFKDKATVEQLMNKVIVFHCEFSQKRGPAMYQALREIDRRLHMEHYPRLFYPEIYVLEGGYKLFYEQQPHLCSGGYVPMADKNFKADCKELYSRHER